MITTSYAFFGSCQVRSSRVSTNSFTAAAPSARAAYAAAQQQERPSAPSIRPATASPAPPRQPLRQRRPLGRQRPVDVAAGVTVVGGEPPARRTRRPRRSACGSATSTLAAPIAQQVVRREPQRGHVRPASSRRRAPPERPPPGAPTSGSGARTEALRVVERRCATAAARPSTSTCSGNGAARQPAEHHGVPERRRGEGAR